MFCIDMRLTNLLIETKTTSGSNSLSVMFFTMDNNVSCADVLLIKKIKLFKYFLMTHAVISVHFLPQVTESSES